MALFLTAIDATVAREYELLASIHNFMIDLMIAMNFIIGFIVLLNFFCLVAAFTIVSHGMTKGV
jgi:hypothetical protein